MMMMMMMMMNPYHNIAKANLHVRSVVKLASCVFSFCSSV